MMEYAKTKEQERAQVVIEMSEELEKLRAQLDAVVQRLCAERERRK